MSFSVRSLFYCIRPDGTAAPFIAVDELPPQLYIRGVPRRLPAAETEGMICLGQLGFPRQSYIVESLPASMSSPPLIDRESQLPRNVTEETLPQHQGLTGPSIASGSRHLMNPQRSAAAGRQFNTSRQDATRRPRRKKMFCSFWLRHGECDYEQQGCRFKHEMPTDLKTLEVLGLRDIPLWYREKHKLPSLLQSNHDSQPLTGDGNRFSTASNVVRSPDRPGPEATAYVAPMSGFVGFSDFSSGDSLPTYPPLDPISRPRATSLTHGQDRVLIQESGITGNHANVHSPHRLKQSSKLRHIYEQNTLADFPSGHTSISGSQPHIWKHGGSAKNPDLTSPGSKGRSESTSPGCVPTRRPHHGLAHLSPLSSINESPSLPAIGSEMINSTNNGFYPTIRKDNLQEEVNLVEFDGHS
ncbi:hypothetical protein Egran_00555 [Elaphomyces granulatus]|uniref:C3H1-type domain-containing protein n=1 Tax=Elaphomyces granulatus TaxID=519963 RepID=A0A232M5M8_9EURO|nr:hypothetical protein Egran_00555 [Elaphomyces granulatus]